jgi:hypothetical protein
MFSALTPSFSANWNNDVTRMAIEARIVDRAGAMPNTSVVLTEVETTDKNNTCNGAQDAHFAFARTQSLGGIKSRAAGYLYPPNQICLFLIQRYATFVHCDIGWRCIQIAQSPALLCQATLTVRFATSNSRNAQSKSPCSAGSGLQFQRGTTLCPQCLCGVTSCFFVDPNSESGCEPRRKRYARCAMECPRTRHRDVHPFAMTRMHHMSAVPHAPHSSGSVVNSNG